MGAWDNLKNFMGIGEDGYEDEPAEETAANNDDLYYEAPAKKKQPTIFQADRKNKNGGNTQTQMQVVIVKPDHFDDVTMIADHLNAKKSVVLNLEVANRETSRRIIDFISGVTYANKGSIRKVANSTFMIVPGDVDIMGELMMEDYDR
jgi:cell division inhibitor SepF